MVFSMHPHVIADNGDDCLYMQDTWLVTADGGEPLAGLPMRIYEAGETRPYTRSADFGVNAAGRLSEPSAVAAGPHGHDLRKHRERRLGRCVSPDIETGRAGDPVERRLVDSRLEQALAAPLLIATRAERADVVAVGRQRADEHRNVEFVVVGEDDDR